MSAPKMGCLLQHIGWHLSQWPCGFRHNRCKKEDEGHFVRSCSSSQLPNSSSSSTSYMYHSWNWNNLPSDTVTVLSLEFLWPSISCLQHYNILYVSHYQLFLYLNCISSCTCHLFSYSTSARTHAHAHKFIV